MNTRTNINIQTLKINTIDALGRTSFSSTMQIGNHVVSKGAEAFGEQNADFVLIHAPTLMVDDSDVFDSTSIKKN